MSGVTIYARANCRYLQVLLYFGRMKIAIVAGGVPTTTFIDAQVNAMAEAGVDMIVIGKKSGTPHYHQNVRTLIIPKAMPAQLVFCAKQLIQCRFKYVPAIYRHTKSFKHFFYDLLFYLPILNAKADKVHIQWATFLHNKELLLDLLGDKIVLSLRGSHINSTPLVNTAVRDTYVKLFPRIKYFHAVSDAIAAEAMKYGANAGAIETIYSFVNDGLLQKEIKPKTGQRTLKIISIGRFYWMKGYEYALDAMAMLKAKGVPFHYTLVAQGDVPDNIRFQVKDLGLDEHLTIINGAGHDEVFRLVEENDVLLLPSIQEGLPNVVLESMAVDTPVIATDCSGISEVITDKVSGFIVNRRDAVAMAEAISTFSRLTDEERFKMALAAKERIKAYHRKDIFIQKMMQLYNKDSK